MVEWKKMSKSLGNFYTLKDIEEKYQTMNQSVLYRAVRLSFMNSKYSSQSEFSFDKLEANFNTINSIDELLKSVDK